MSLPTVTRWRVVIFAILSGVSAAMQVGKVIVAIPIVRAELGIGLVTAGWIMSIVFANSAVLGVTAGLLTDRIGHRRALLSGLGGMLVGSAAGALATDGTELLLARFVEGIGFVATVIAAPSLIVSVTAPGDRRKALTWWGTYMPLGMAVMMLITPPILARVGWRGLWLANAALIAVFAAGLAWSTRGLTLPQAPRRTWADLRLTLARPGPLLLAGCFATYTVQYVGLSSWLPTFLIEVQGRDTASTATVVAGIVAANILGNLGGGWLLGRGAPRWALIAAVGLTLGLLGVGVYADGVPVGLKLTMAACFTLVGGITPAALLNGVPEHAPSPAHIGTTNGTVVQGLNVGSLLAPPLFALAVAHLGGWSRASWLFFAAGCLAVVFALLLRRIELCAKGTASWTA